jgi:hypothetical protein
MPTKQPTRPALPSNDLVLAAIERAICHDSRDHEAEPLSTIKEHLGLPHNSWTTLELRPKLAELQSAGLIEQSRRSSRDVWGLTTKGRKRLNAARGVTTLPEAPQHARCREARTAATERIAGFRGDLRGALDEAIALLEADTETDSAAWFEISACIKQADCSHQLPTVSASGRGPTTRSQTATTTRPVASAHAARYADGMASSGSDRPTRNGTCAKHSIMMPPS